MTLYDRLVVIRKLPYPAYWAIMGLLFFGGELLLLRSFGETAVSPLQLAVATAGFFGVLIGWTWIARGLAPALSPIDAVVALPEEDASSWANEQAKNLFTFRKPATRWVTLVFCALALASLLLSGLPFRSPLVNAIIAIEFILAAAICAHGACFLIGLLALLSRIRNLPIRTTFYRPQHPAIMRLYRYYSMAALVVLVLYLILILIVWLSPFGIQSYMAFWPALLAFYPFAMFVWSMIQVHYLLRKIKQSNIDVINEQVQCLFERLRAETSVDNAQAVAQLMDIQKRVEGMREWPLAFEGVFTFVATAAVSAGQVVTTLLTR